MKCFRRLGFSIEYFRGLDYLTIFTNSANNQYLSVRQQWFGRVPGAGI